MANSFTFNGVNRIIQIDDTDPVDMDVLYSKWKKWVSEGDNGKYATAFRYVGGDPTVGGNALGTTYFILNEWSIRPHSSNHILQIDGNLFRDGGGNPFTPALGNNNVTIQQQVSNLIDQRVTENPIEDRLDYMGTVYIDTIDGVSGTSYPIGTSGTPVNNFINAITIAQSYSLRNVYILSDVLHPDNVHDRFNIIGDTIRNVVIFQDTENINNITYNNVTISGSLGEDSHDLFFRNCHINSVTNMGGEFINCRIQGTFKLSTDYTNSMWHNCYSNGIEGENTEAILDFNGDTKSVVSIHGWNGQLTVKNMDNSESVLDLDCHSGHIHIDPSCTAGKINVRGNGLLYDDSGGGIDIDIEGNINPDGQNRLQEMMGLKKGMPITISKTGRSVGNISQTFTKQPDGSVVITRE